jgi:hypothetical protein
MPRTLSKQKLIALSIVSGLVLTIVLTILAFRGESRAWLGLYFLYTAKEQANEDEKYFVHSGRAENSTSAKCSVRD